MRFHRKNHCGVVLQKMTLSLKTRPKPSDFKGIMEDRMKEYIIATTIWAEGFENKTIPQAITRLKDDFGMFFRDYNLPSIAKAELFKLIDEWAKKEILDNE